MRAIIIKSLFSLLFIMVCGFVIRKKEWIDNHSVAALSKILMGLALPITIILSMQQAFSKELLIDALIICALSSLMICMMLFIGFLLSKILKSPPNQRGVLIFASAFPNSVYIGMPVIKAVLGDEALFYVSMYVLVHYTLSPTLGVYFLKKDMDVSETSQQKNVPMGTIIASIVIGLTMFVFSIKIPPLVHEPLQMISSIMTPLSMIIIGNNLAKEPFKEIFKDYRLLIVSFVKLIMAPLLLYFFISLFLSDKMIISVLVYLASMPVAALTTIFAEEVGADVVFASRLVLVSTVLSLFTIPLISQLIS